MKNLSIFTRFTSKGASSRYRFFMYIDKLMANDFNVEINSFFYQEYLHDKYLCQVVSIKKIIYSYIGRLFDILKSSNNLYIEYEIFPKLPYFFEALLLKRKRYILNFDDDVWDNYKKSKLLKNKYDNLVKNANGVIVANDYLYEKLKLLNENIIKIPTVIDLNDYNKKYEKFERFSIVWIGTPVTYKYIISHSDIFKALAVEIDFNLLIIADKSLESKKIDGVNMMFYDWSTKTEVEILKRSHIGIMPLDYDVFSSGKSAFKLIQYLAAGIPSVATNLGENRNVIENNKNGFLVNNTTEWIDAIKKLHDDKIVYDKIASKSLSTSKKFSIQTVSYSCINFFVNIFQERV